MKTILIFVIFIIIAPFSGIAAQAADWETYELISRLLAVREPGAPAIHEDSVVFTADSRLRRVGVSFAHESFARIYWFRQLLRSQDRANPIILPGEKIPSPYMDSGIQFHVYRVPDHIRELEYRLVIDGLWTVDPFNPLVRRDPVSGLSMSVLRMPYRQPRPNPLDGLPVGVNFMFRAPSGETVTVAGNFNSWDPFMYELREGPAGVYSLLIPLPPGTYHYVYFHRGERHTDQFNLRRIYSRDGREASEIVVP